MSHEEDLPPEVKKMRAILADRTPASTEAIDARKKKMEAAKQRESLRDELRLLLLEWDRIKQRNAELEASKVADDPFLKRSIEARRAALRVRFEQIDKALKALNEDSETGQASETPSPSPGGKSKKE